MAVLGVTVVPMGINYISGRIAPPTKFEENTSSMLREIKTAIEDQNKNKLDKLINSNNLEEKYPLGFAFFYSDGRKTLHYGKLKELGIKFEPSNIKVNSISESKLCISGLNIESREKSQFNMSWPTCINMKAGGSVSV